MYVNFALARLGMIPTTGGMEKRCNSEYVRLAGIWYVAPRLIIHYVAAHHCCPPLAFLEAVENPSQVGKLGRPQFTYESIRESIAGCLYQGDHQLLRRN